MIRPHLCLASLAAVLTVAFAACSNDDGGSPSPSDDPRCAALCAYEPPPTDDAFAVCSDESLHRCSELCEARIEETSTLCAECLLEDAVFHTPHVPNVPDRCLPDDTCYVGLTGWCENGCWIWETDFGNGGGGSCGDDDCADARERYDQEVASGGACVYSKGDDAAREDCIRQVYPREDVTCEVQFAPVTACAEICGSGT